MEEKINFTPKSVEVPKQTEFNCGIHVIHNLNILSSESTDMLFQDISMPDPLEIRGSILKEIYKDSKIYFKIKSKRVTASQKKLKDISDMSSKIHEGDESNLQVIHVEGKGRGVMNKITFEKGEYVCKYDGELITRREGRRREKEYDLSLGSFLYFFTYNNKQWCIDATRESNKVGRLINHSREHPNLSPKVIAIGGKPNIIFTANQIINKEEELLYDYGETRKLILEEHHWLNN